MDALLTKPGAHGTLYRYSVKYRDEDPSCPEFTWSTWAYDSEHALDRWYEGDHDGWKIIGRPTRVRSAVAA